MKNPGDVIREAIKKDGRGQAAIGTACGVSQSMISLLINGKREGKRDKVEALFKELGLSYADVYGEGIEISGAVPEEVAFRHRSRNVPLISWVQAGQWMEVEDTFHPGDGDGYILADNVSRSAFALRVVGDSMEPEFIEGDIVIVDPEIQVNSGDYVVAKIKNNEGGNGEATMKKFLVDGDRIYLKPLNKEYKMMDMTGKNFCIVGCVVQKTKKYKN